MVKFETHYTIARFVPPGAPYGQLLAVAAW
jgi:hypothetical protein